MALPGFDEKACPMCAESVKVAAVRCRFCGYDFSGRTPILPARDAGSVGGAAKALGGGMMKVVLAAVAILVLAGWWARSGDEAPVGDGGGAVEAPSNAAPAATTLTAEQRRACTAPLAKAEQAGLVRKIEPSLSRITVDEPMWREIGPENRVALVGFAACNWNGVTLGDIGFDRRVTIVGWQSGQRIASSMGGLYAGN